MTDFSGKPKRPKPEFISKKVEISETLNRGDGTLIIEQVSMDVINLSAIRSRSDIFGVSLEFRLENESQEKMRLLKDLLIAASKDDNVAIPEFLSGGRFLRGGSISSFATGVENDRVKMIKIGIGERGDFYLSLDFDRINRKGSLIYKIDRSICPNFFAALQKFL